MESAFPSHGGVWRAHRRTTRFPNDGLPARHTIFVIAVCCLRAAVLSGRTNPGAGRTGAQSDIDLFDLRRGAGLIRVIARHLFERKTLLDPGATQRGVDLWAL